MDEKPMVSIIIPVYNGEDYIKEAIDSALAQTYENCEIIVVNDGSTDNTETIVLGYGDKVKYYAKKNGGVSTALNMGIAHMKGRYIQYLPADDTLHEDKLKKQMDAILQTGDEMSVSWTGWNWNYVKEKKLEMRIREYPYDKKKYTDGIYPLLFSLVNSVTVLFNKKYIDLVGGFDETLYTSQDYDMWLRIFQDKKTIYIDEPLVNYRIHEKQGTQADPEFTKNCIDMSKKLVASMDSKRIEKMFGNEYRFVSYMMDFYLAVGWLECYEEMQQRLKKLDEPDDVERQCRNLAAFLDEQGNGCDVILYCAGKNGKRLLRNLTVRGINVAKFSDGDKTKHGTLINGVECVAIDTLSKEKSYVIVTKDNPSDIVEMLRKKGFKHVDTYERIGDKVQYTLPIKQKMLEMR